MSKSKTKQKKSSAAKNIAIFFIVFVILEGLIIYGLTRVFRNENSVAELGGYSFYLMDTNNMSPDVPEYSLVIASNGSRDKKGSAVLCKNVGAEGTTVAWLYDISSKGDTVDGIVYTVYQQSNFDKMYDLQADDVIGTATSYYTVAGKIITFVKTPFGIAACIGLPIMLLIVLELIITIAHHTSRGEKRSKKNDYDYEDDDNVTLDDFLYGGESDNVYATAKPKDTYEEEFESKYAAVANRNSAESVIMPELKFESEVKKNTDVNESAVEPAEEAVQAQAAEIAEPAEEAEETVQEVKTEIDPSYYAKASELIDGAVAAHSEPQQTAEAPSEPAEQVQPKTEQPEQVHRKKAQHTQHKKSAPARRKPTTPVVHQDANAAIEQLMKMMEEEQSKLKTTAEKLEQEKNK